MNKKLFAEIIEGVEWLNARRLAYERRLENLRSHVFWLSVGLRQAAIRALA